MRKIYFTIIAVLLIFISVNDVQARELWYPYGDADYNSYAEKIKEAYEAGDEDAVHSYLNTSVTLLLKDAYSTEYLEYMFNHGENLWMKEIAVTYGKYPYNEASEDTSHFSMYTSAEQGYKADENAGSQYPSNQIVEGLYYVDGTVSTDNSDAGKIVNIDSFLYPEPKLIEKDLVQYVTNAEEIEIWEYPTKLSDVIGYFYYSDEIQIIGMTEDERWYLVELGKKDAYIENAYLGDTVEAMIVDVTEDGIIYYGEMTEKQKEEQSKAAEAISNANAESHSTENIIDEESLPDESEDETIDENNEEGQIQKREKDTDFILRVFIAIVVSVSFVMTLLALAGATHGKKRGE